MGPSSDHELEIARIVDQIDLDGRLDASVLDEIIATLKFIPSPAENDFLVDYIRWRMDHPIVSRGLRELTNPLRTSGLQGTTKGLLSWLLKVADR